jgi:hypothetical protein
MFSALDYPHWIMIAGSLLVAFGFLGIAFSRNRNGMPVRNEESIKREEPAARHGRIVLTRIINDLPPSTGGS